MLSDSSLEIHFLLTLIRIGLNHAKLGTKMAPQILKLPPKELQTMKTPNKNPRSHGFVPRTMPHFAQPRAPSARRSSSRPGLRMCKTGSGKTQLRSDRVFIMQVAMPKSLKALLRRVKPGPARQTQYSASANPK